MMSNRLSDRLHNKVYNSNTNNVIYVGEKTDYYSTYNYYKEDYRDYLFHIIQLLLRDCLELLLQQNANSLEELNKIEFGCNCNGEYRTPHSSHYTMNSHNRNRLREHNRNSHVCLKKSVNIIIPQTMELLKVWEKDVWAILKGGDNISKLESNISDHSSNSNISDNSDRTDNSDESIHMNNASNISSSLYDMIHDGEYDDWMNKTEMDEISCENYKYTYTDRIGRVINFLMPKIHIGKTSEHPNLIIGAVLINTYRIESIICESSNSTVIRAVDVTNNKTYAIKLGVSSMKANKEICEEVRIMNKFNNVPYLSHAEAFFKIKSQDNKSEHVCVVTKLYGTDLYEQLINNERYFKRGLDINSVRYIAFQLVTALRLFHQKNIIHNDIKLENIVFKNKYIDKSYKLNEDDIPSNNDLNIVLIDYGLSTDMTNTQVIPKLQGTLPYLSPEELSGYAHSFESDIWALGVSLLEIVTGISTFSVEPLDNIVIIEHILNYNFETINGGIGTIDDLNRYRLDFSEETRRDIRGVEYDLHYIPYSANDEHLADFLSGCLRPNKSERYGIDQLYYHPFLNRYTRYIDKKRNIKLD
jgi:serine/threonine protein kinase